jgi:hypothetical protein
MEEYENKFEKSNPGWRPTFSIIVGVGWLIFLIAWFAFFASSYSFNRNFAIFLLSVLIIVTLLGGVWAVWGIKMIPKEGKEIIKTLGFKWRIQVSMIIPFATLIFLILWFWLYADGFNGWQNLAVILITILVVGGLLGSIWARWGMKHGWKFEKKAEAAFYHHKEDNKEEGKEEDKD